MQSTSTSFGTAGLGLQKGQHLAEVVAATVDVTNVDIRVAAAVVGTASATEEGTASFDRAVTVAVAEVGIVAADAG